MARMETALWYRCMYLSAIALGVSKGIEGLKGLLQ